MADADIGYGTRVMRGTGGPPLNYTDVGELTEFSPPSLTRDTVDATHSRSPDRFKEYIGAMIDAGELSFTIQYADPSKLDVLIADMRSKAPVPYRYQWPNGVQWDFPGLITAIEPDTSNEEKMTAAITVKLSGKPGFVGA